MPFNLVPKQLLRYNIFHQNGYFLLPGYYFSKMADHPIKNIMFDSLKEKILGKTIPLIDVREAKELKEDGKIPNSVNIPLDQIAEAFKLPNSKFLAKYGIEKPAESDEFVVSCKSGRRATFAFNKLLPLGYKNVLVYSGSFEEWKNRGAPFEKD